MRITLGGKPPNWVSRWPIPDENVACAVRAAMHGSPHKFGRLVFVVVLQNPETRDHLSRLLPLDHDCDKVALALCRQHHEIFEDWLCLGLEDKLADLEAYASGLGEAVGSVANQWLSLDQRDYLVPRDALPPEKRLFQSDAEALLIILASKQ